MSAVSNTSHSCSNPGCTEVGNFQKCGKCESVYYHSKECQKEHWKHGHREACADLTKKKIDEVNAKANSNSAKAEALNNESSELRDTVPSLRNESSEFENEVSRKRKTTITTLTSAIDTFGNARGRLSSQQDVTKFQRDGKVILINVVENVAQMLSLKLAAIKKTKSALENNIKATEAGMKAVKASGKAEKAKKRAERLKANLDTKETTSLQSKTAGSTGIADDLDVD